jgi:hypothetical protein
MRMLHQKLHLQHHSHTGKLIHHRHTSYRSLALLLIIAGACMAGISYMQRVAADELFSVSASVHVPVPHTPPTITQPEDTSSVSGTATTVIGSCPIVTPQAVIAIQIDGTTVGTAACNASNDFSFPATLTSGSHTITALPYTVDGDHGPASSPVRITAKDAPAATAASATLTSNTLFTRLSSDNTVDWHGTLTGSKKSYPLLLDWGDGSYQSVTAKPGPQHLQHHYATLAAYNISIGLQTAPGAYSYVQLAAANPQSVAPAASTDTTSLYQSAPTGTVIGLYGLFVTAVCLTAIIRLHASAFAYADIRFHHGKA